MPIIRLASASDLDAMVALFEVSEVSALAEPPARQRIWGETLDQQGVFVFVSDGRDAP